MFANLPEEISAAISDILSQAENKQWMQSAKELHERYTTREKGSQESFIHNPSDILAYLGLRVPATYAQIYSALLQVHEMIPAWKPTSLLDIGSGPGTAVWAAKTIWPSITNAACIDRERYFQFLGKEIMQKSGFSLAVQWKVQDVRNSLAKNAAKKYDVVILANVLNELSETEQEQLLDTAYALCQGVVIVIEPGTPLGFTITQTTAKMFAEKSNLIAPYIQNSFVENNDYWLHFSQRFIRPEFQRYIRQKMRASSLMASDWEEAKYTYAAISKIPAEETIWGRCIGPVAKQKGFLEIPILTEKEVMPVKVLKRHKKEYTFAKNLAWGDIIRNSSDILYKE